MTEDKLMGLVFYGEVGVLWTCIAALMQVRAYGVNWKLLPCVVLNVCLWPIAAVLVVWRAPA